MEYEDTRISKLRDYLMNIINTLASNKKNRINANMLSNDINNYSLDKIPTNPEIEKWIVGVAKKKDIYSFRSRKSYSQDTINNLKNIGFFEEFERVINSNNKEGNLPDIEGIEKIECLNCGTMNNAGTNTAEFDIQIQITYRENDNNRQISL
jgi:hypothetical protein